MIYVTKPFLPPKEEYQKYVDDIWNRQWLTNNGPLVMELEQKLKSYLQTPNVLFLNNGTIALQLAIKALRLQGSIITTPFSFIATTSSIVWEGCKPQFVDIDPSTLNIDPLKIESSINKETCAIMATHVYGNPCDIDAIDKIARKHNIPVIYDGAHCFGAKYKGQSVFNYGTICTTSFHATKLFHTIEGGAVFTQDETLLKRMDLMRNFGYYGFDNFPEVGINGKNSEFHAAMGLANLKYIEEILVSRKEQSLRYDKWLADIHAQRIVISKDATFNHAYYPMIFESEETTLKVIRELERNQISPRRYFYPSLSTVPLFQSETMPISESLSERVICLPLYFALSMEEIDYIAKTIIRACTV